MTAAPTRDQLHTLLGHQVGAIAIQSVTRQRRTGFGDWWLDDLVLGFDDGVHARALWLHPPEGQPPAPALLYCHAHGNFYEMGCAELTEGRPALQGPYAPDLQARGIAALCIEMPCFGGRADQAESPTAKAGLWAGKPLFGRMLAELSAGFDWLATQPEVAMDRIGVMGISMGGTHAWWLGALEPRIKAVAHLCCFADLATLIELGSHDGHGIYMTVPGLLPVARSGQIAGLIAPRAQLVCAGMQDWSTPPEAFEKGLEDLRAAYTEDGLETHVETDLGHAESPAMRAAVLDFLSRQL